MILYRIISQEEYEAYRRGEKYYSKSNWDDANKMYEVPSSAENYIYFFPYYEACTSWNGDYIIRVDIPDELLEKGIGTYSNPLHLSAGVEFMLLDEYRVNVENFDPETQILDFVKAEDLTFGRTEVEWEKGQAYMDRVEEAFHKKIPLFDKYLDYLDYSGAPELEELRVPQEAKPIVDLIKQKLEEEKSKKENKRTKYIRIEDVKQNVECTRTQNLNWSYFSPISETPEYAINYLIELYGYEETQKLFNETQSLKQIKTIKELLMTGYIKDSYSDRFIAEADAHAFKENGIYRENLLYVAREIASYDSEHEEECFKKLMKIVSIRSIVYGHLQISLEDMIHYVYGEDLSKIEVGNIRKNKYMDREIELKRLLEDTSRSLEEKEMLIKAIATKRVLEKKQAEREELKIQNDIRLAENPENRETAEIPGNTEPGEE